MTRATIAGGAFAIVLVLLALAAGYFFLQRDAEPAATASSRESAPSASPTTSSTTAAQEVHPGFLYGRVTTDGGIAYEGRLRWGGSQEAFWGDYFNGRKDGNPWAAQVPAERLPTVQRPIEIFGLEIIRRERPIDLGRLFMARFGDIARIEKHGADVRVVLKSGTVFGLDRLSFGDFDDGVRVWDAQRGVVDLVPRQIRTIELLPTEPLGAVPDRLHGTVRTRDGELTGFVQWDREECVGSDELDGRTAGGELTSLRYDTIRSIARHPGGGALVTLLDGREVVLSDTQDVGPGNRGIYVDDPRYGRVLVSWEAFERLDFSPADSGPAYGDFPPGHPLAGTVITRDGRRLAGRLVYDLDESETTETLDAPAQGVDYTIPFGLVASIELPEPEERGARRARLTLHEGEELQLERAGDLDDRNAGLLVFVEGRQSPEYVPWADVEQIRFDRPPAMYPPLDGNGESGAEASAE